MIQTQQQSLSESEIGTLKDWLTSAGADLFLKVIRSEMALTQAEAAYHHISAIRQVLDGKRELAAVKAKFTTEKANELEFLLEKFAAMRDEGKPYEFKTITLTP